MEVKEKEAIEKETKGKAARRGKEKAVPKITRSKRRRRRPMLGRRSTRRRWVKSPRRRRDHSDWANVKAARENEDLEKATREKEAKKRKRPQGKEYKEQETMEMAAK